MKRTFIALASTLAFVGGSAFAQQQQETPGKTPSATEQPPSGGSITERAKETTKKIGEKSKETASKAKDKTKETASKAKQDSDQKSAQASKDKDKSKDSKSAE